MHGNTYKSETGYKTRHFDTMLEEIQKFFKIHKKYNTIHVTTEDELYIQGQVLGVFREYN